MELKTKKNNFMHEPLSIHTKTYILKVPELSRKFKNNE